MARKGSQWAKQTPLGRGERVGVDRRLAEVLGRVEPVPTGPDLDVQRMLVGMGWLKPRGHDA